MSSFKRASLPGSEELFRPTRPTLVEEDVINEVLDRPVPDKNVRDVGLTSDEVDLLLAAIQAARFPEQHRSKLPLDKFERLGDLKVKLQGVYAQD